MDTSADTSTIDLTEAEVVYVDPVYATVTSKISLNSGGSADLKWIEHCGMSGGLVKFLTQGSVRKRSSVSYYVKMGDDTSTNMVADYFDKAWLLRTPSIILSVISDPHHWKPWKNDRQIEDFQEGIVEALNTTSVWLLTDGINSGVTKMIGDAIRREKERRQLLAANFSQQFVASDRLEKLPRITAIGIVPTSKLSYSELFDTEDTEIQIELGELGSLSMLEELNPDLTNFIMMDNIKTQSEMNECRLAVEKRFRLPVGKPKQYKRVDESDGDNEIITATTTPFVGLLVQGSPADIEHVCDLVKIKAPVVILKGTGGAADLFSFTIEEIKHRGDEDHINTYVKPELLKKIMTTYPKEFKHDELARNQCRDRIIACVLYSIKEQQNFLTVLDVEGDNGGLKNLSKYVLMALFESQEPKKGKMFQYQLQRNLKLTLDWNRHDLAVSRIFQKYNWFRIKVTPSLLDLSMIKKDRHKFVELFLEKDAVELHKYFTHRKLRYLINNFEDSEFFTTICLGEMLGYSPISDYPVGKRFVNGDRSGFNKLLFKATHMSGLGVFTDVDQLEMNDSNMATLAIAERKAMNILVYWAALNYDTELTKTLWKKTEEPIAIAMVVSMLWHNMAKRWCPDVDLKRKLRKSAKEFGGLAVKLLDYSYQDSNINTIALLDKKLADFDNKTIVELAHLAKNRNFIAHYICQKWLNRRWFGNLQIKKYDWGPIKLPNWVKIYMSLMLIFPMFIWIDYDLADRKRRRKMIEDQISDDIDEQRADPHHSKYTPVFVDDWIVKPSSTMMYKMKNAWLNSKERFKVPIHLQFYYLWSAPITKFWLNQIFYIAFLILFSLATLWPYCGSLKLDMAVFGWTLMIWTEIVRTTIVKRKKYRELDLFWTVVEIFVMFFLIIVVFTARIPQYFKPFFTYLTTKFIMSCGLIYFYYRVLVVFLPISSVLGPFIISIRRMIKHDFLLWFRMFIIIMVSGAIAIQAVLYPNYPLIPETIRVSFSRAFFAMFLTKIDDLEGAECSSMYQNVTVIDRCYERRNPLRSLFQRTNESSFTKDELSKCPYSSLGGYFVVIQYLLIVKLILITLLYALFSRTTAAVQEESEAIYKFQKYGLIVDFEEKLIMPPPLNFLSYIVMIFQTLFKYLLCLFKKCKNCSNCCRKDQVDGARKVSIMMMQYSEDYSYWGNFVKKLDHDEEDEEKEKDRAKIESEKLDKLTAQFVMERKHNCKMVEQISTLETNVANCQMALEELKHMLEKLNPHLQPSLTSEERITHVLSRRSPYPETTIVRFSVFDKYVPWETPYSTYDPVVYTCPVNQYALFFIQTPYSTYDPVVYTCPVNQFPTETQPYVDTDFLKSIIDSRMMSSEDVSQLEVMSSMPVWNTVATVTVNGKERKVNRQTYIKQNGKQIQYSLDTCNLPINPMGRTGIRGKGKLNRWGPNHNVLLLITRWKRKDEQAVMVEDKKVLEVIAIQKTGESYYKLPRGGDYGYMTVYSAASQKFLSIIADESKTKIKPDMNSDEMLKFFKSQLSVPFTSAIIYRGYFDDQYNTDNAWREVEVWNIHFDQPNDILNEEPNQWKTVSFYNTFHGSQDLILRQAATLHGAYY